MKVNRKFSTAVGLSAILAGSLLASGCEFINKVRAKDMLNQGAILYNQGRIKDAKEYFKGASDLIPTNSVAKLYYGSTVYKEFQNAPADENRKKLGEEALAVFKSALELAPASDCKIRDSAIGYVAQVYDDLADEANNREWLLKRAEGECAKNEVKAQTYYAVAVKLWNCSYSQTTRYATKDNKDPFHYRNMDYPDAVADKQKANTCADQALQFVEKSIAIDPEGVDALFYKGLILREKQKLTKEEPKRKELNDMAQKISDQATALAKKKEAEQKAKEAEGGTAEKKG